MEALHKFSLYPKFSLSKYYTIKRAGLSFEHAWNISSTALITAGFDESGAHDFVTWRETFDESKESALLSTHSIRIVTIEDPTYPPLLKNIFDPPVALFVRGTLDNTRPRLAVVGTRKMTSYGKHMTEDFVSELVRAGIEIVSGLALGIDGVAHKAALEARGTTLAVLGAGIDPRSIYPRMHYELSERIIDNHGALVGEYPPGAGPTPYSFPRRNRIVAGITLGTLVIEADEKSGALITSSCALEYGREVYAIPHPLTSPTGKGPHQLIRDGACLVTSPTDVLSTLDISAFERHTRAEETIPYTSDESTLLSFFTGEAIHIDEITRLAPFPQSKVIALITVLEMKGRIKNTGNMMYIIKN
jgi:DNA processing protein